MLASWFLSVLQLQSGRSIQELNTNDVSAIKNAWSKLLKCRRPKKLLGNALYLIVVASMLAGCATTGRLQPTCPPKLRCEIYQQMTERELVDYRTGVELCIKNHKTL